MTLAELEKKNSAAFQHKRGVQSPAPLSLSDMNFEHSIKIPYKTVAAQLVSRPADLLKFLEMVAELVTDKDLSRNLKVAASSVKANLEGGLRDDFQRVIGDVLDGTAEERTFASQGVI